MMSSYNPSQSEQAMLSELGSYVIADPKPFVVDVGRSRGMWLATVGGRRLFDWAGYYGSKLIGHNHPRLYEPAYVERLIRAANNKVANPDFLTAECLDYYRLIHDMAPRCMRSPNLEVYAVNSGAEAVENMMKYLINLHLQKHAVERRPNIRRRFICFDQAFHGRTVFALGVTGLSADPIVTRDYHGFADDNIRVPFPAIDTDADPAVNRKRTETALGRVEDALRRDAHGIVAIIVEPIQGAGGHRTAETEFFRGLSVLAHRYGVYLGLDEVQTAGGQTGSFFAVDQFDLPYPPQAIAAAKKLACGVVYMLQPMEDRGVLDSTWGGHLADMVRFVQEMAIVRDERLIESISEKTDLLLHTLRCMASKHHDLISNIRGMGLYQGFSLRGSDTAGTLAAIALEHEDLLLLKAGPDTIRLRPVLDVSNDDIAEFGHRLDRSLCRLRTMRDGAGDNRS